MPSASVEHGIYTLSPLGFRCPRDVTRGPSQLGCGSSGGWSHFHVCGAACPTGPFRRAGPAELGGADGGGGGAAIQMQDVSVQERLQADPDQPHAGETLPDRWGLAGLKASSQPLGGGGACVCAQCLLGLALCSPSECYIIGAV